MNIGVIFAGGSGQRMHTASVPKQFLELHGKPIIVHTLDVFERCEDIDAVVVACIADWVERLREMVGRFQLRKVQAVVPGGSSGQESIYLGLCAAEKLGDKDSVVLIHDGVRPLIDVSLLTRNIESVHQYGNAITVTPVIETIVLQQAGKVETVLPRTRCSAARAPQSFRLGDILAVHRRANGEGRGDFIDSAGLMSYYGYQLHTVECNLNNIKITTPIDYYVFRAIADAREDEQMAKLL